MYSAVGSLPEFVFTQEYESYKGIHFKMKNLVIWLSVTWKVPDDDSFMVKPYYN